MPTLSDLDADTCGIVTRIDPNGAYRERLHGMGIGPGKSLTVIRRGRSMIVDVCGGRLAIDATLGRTIHVDIQSDASADNADTPAAESARAASRTKVS